MFTIILESFPDEVFWEAYQVLWDNSMYPNAFKSPNYIRSLASTHRDMLIVFAGWAAPQQLKGAVFFRKSGNVLKLLSDVRSDHNFFTFHRDCSNSDISVFFNSLFAEVKTRKWSLLLNNLPYWAPYHDIFTKASRQSGLFCLHTNHSICAMLEAGSPESLPEEIEKSKEHRAKTHKLLEVQKAVFEVFEDEEDIENWVDGYCRFHIERWKGTPSPSKFVFQEERAVLLDSLRAWIGDKILVRFSIKKDGQRIAFVIGLREGDALIHHSTSYDPEYFKISPGKVLTYKIIHWMKGQGMSRLDFGEGAEEYKFTYANKVYPLGKSFISARTNVPFILNAKISKFKREQVKRNPALRQFYRLKIWPAGQRVKALFFTFMPFDLF